MILKLNPRIINGGDMSLLFGLMIRENGFEINNLFQVTLWSLGTFIQKLKKQLSLERKTEETWFELDYHEELLPPHKNFSNAVKTNPD